MRRGTPVKHHLPIKHPPPVKHLPPVKHPPPVNCLSPIKHYLSVKCLPPIKAKIESSTTMHVTLPSLLLLTLVLMRLMLVSMVMFITLTTMKLVITMPTTMTMTTTMIISRSSRCLLRSTTNTTLWCSIAWISVKAKAKGPPRREVEVRPVSCTTPTNPSPPLQTPTTLLLPPSE